MCPRNVRRNSRDELHTYAAQCAAQTLTAWHDVCAVHLLPARWKALSCHNFLNSTIVKDGSKLRCFILVMNVWIFFCSPFLLCRLLYSRLITFLFLKTLFQGIDTDYKKKEEKIYYVLPWEGGQLGC